jgi:hypothetical protein
MANVTERGKKLAKALGVTDAETCSLIARAAVTYQRLEIEACNGDQRKRFSDLDQWQAWLNKQRRDVGRRLTRLVATLGDGYGVRLDGDPRGCVVKVTTPMLGFRLE